MIDYIINLSLASLASPTLDHSERYCLDSCAIDYVAPRGIMKFKWMLIILHVWVAQFMDVSHRTLDLRGDDGHGWSC